MTELKRLDLHEFHKSKSAKFTGFAGWEMPVSYGSSLNEHIHTRTHCSLFDVSHMGEIRVTGKDASSYLDFILVNIVSTAEPGSAIYSPFCYENGGTIDDLIAYKKSDNDYLLCVNASNIAKDYDHFLEHLGSFDCKIENASDGYGQIAIQGPFSEMILSKIIDNDLSDLPKMSFREVESVYGEILVSRTGYTGEDGFEIYFHSSKAEKLANSFDQLKTNIDVKWAGLAARDTLRLEAGYPLYGNEISESISPLAAKLSWSVKWTKENFIGKNALIKEKNTGSRNVVLYYEVNDRRIPRGGAEVFFEDDKVGRVLSGGFSPTIKKPFGTFLVDASVADQKHKGGWEIDVRKSRIPVILTNPVLKKI